MNDHLSTDLLIDYAHGELRAEDDAFAHAHLATCGSCRAELDAELAFAEALRSDAARDELEFPGAVRAAIWTAVESERPPLAARVAAFFRPVVAMPIAAVAIALVVFAGPLTHGATPTAVGGTRVDAAYYLEAHAAQQAQNPFTDRAGASVMETSMMDGGSPDAPPVTDAVAIRPAALASLADASLANGLDVVR